MSTLLWITSFLYLVCVSGYIAATLRADDPGDDEDPEDTPMKQTISMVVMLAGGTLGFVVLIIAIETIW
ncbi:MAG: hypothetical protein ACYS22_01680 [Planctomycetota bacterium]